jgi:hypothetical protein
MGDVTPSPQALPCLRRSGFAQAGVKGEGEEVDINVYFWEAISY